MIFVGRPKKNVPDFPHQCQPWHVTGLTRAPNFVRVSVFLVWFTTSSLYRPCYNWWTKMFVGLICCFSVYVKRVTTDGQNFPGYICDDKSIVGTGLRSFWSDSPPAVSMDRGVTDGLTFQSDVGGVFGLICNRNYSSFNCDVAKKSSADWSSISRHRPD